MYRILLIETGEYLLTHNFTTLLYSSEEENKYAHSNLHAAEYTTSQEAKAVLLDSENKWGGQKILLNRQTLEITEDNSYLFEIVEV